MNACILVFCHMPKTNLVFFFLNSDGDCYVKGNLIMMALEFSGLDKVNINLNLIIDT